MTQEPLEAARSFWTVVFSAGRDSAIVIMLIVFVVGAWRHWFVFGNVYDESRAEVAQLREIHSRALDAALTAVHSDDLNQLQSRVESQSRTVFKRPELRAIAAEAEQVGSGRVRRKILVGGGLPRREPQIFKK